MPDNRHFIPSALPLRVSPQITITTVMGMNPDDFGKGKAKKVRNLLAQHTITEYVCVRDTLGLYSLIDAQAVQSVADHHDHVFEPEELEAFETPTFFTPLLLNNDDYTVLETTDDILTPAFLTDLLALLRKAANWQTPEEYLVDMDRKGFMVSNETDPSWSDYKALLAL